MPSTEISRTCSFVWASPRPADDALAGRTVSVHSAAADTAASPTQARRVYFDMVLSMSRESMNLHRCAVPYAYRPRRACEKTADVPHANYWVTTASPRTLPRG